MQTRAFTQRGVTLVEALIGFLVLSLGLLAAVRMQSTMRLNADISRQRTEAVRLAQQDMEALRSFSSHTAFQGIASERVDVAGGRTRFALSQAVDSHELAVLKSTSVRVSWADRAGSTQAVYLHSSIGGTLPEYSAVLALPPQGQSIALPPGVPAASTTWIGSGLPGGKGRRVLKPLGRGTTAWVLDAAGQVTAVCSGISATTPARSLTDADLTHCEAISGQLLSGYVRFSLGGTPDALRANDMPLQLSVSVTLDASATAPPHCDSEALKTVSYAVSGTPHTEAVALDATPDSVGAISWVERGERFVTYSCVIVAPAGTQGWSGSFAVMPTAAWALGLTASTYKVCRYSADQDGSGRIDGNSEHPQHYVDVQGALSQQNYLVIRGDLPCPTGVPPHNDASVATVQHQP